VAGSVLVMKRFEAREGSGDDKRVRQISVWRILGCGRTAFPSSAQNSRVIQIEVSETIISGPSHKRKRADGSIGLHGSRRVLDLVVDALSELCGQAHALADRLKLPRICAALRRGKIDQCSSHLSQRLNGARFRLRRGIALPFGNDEPEEAPNRREQHPQEQAPAEEDFANAWLGLGSLCARDRRGQVRTAMRTKLCGLINFILAFATRVHIYLKLRELSLNYIRQIRARLVRIHRSETHGRESIRGRSHRRQSRAESAISGSNFLGANGPVGFRYRQKRKGGSCGGFLP
jgi:hypothetical protein